MVTTLAALLHRHLATRTWSFEQLAEEADLPRNTVYRWTRGEVKRVRHWQDLARIARALALTAGQTDALLAAGGHPGIATLRERITDADDRALLAPWVATSVHNLPAQLTRFFGRQDELQQLVHLLGTSRLVTLTGPGGSGKTRLALEAAHAVMAAFEETCFVDLAPIRDPERVLPRIAWTLGLDVPTGGTALTTLAEELRNRRVLLVLDNVEQVVAAAPMVSALLATTPGVTAIVTSRTRLDVRGEHEFVVPPLPLPCPDASLAERASNPSIALLVDRARAVDHTFTLTERNAAFAADVCSRLEGLPLAIELAAANTRRVTLRTMSKRIPSRLALATGGPRDVPDRQRTLQATIAWSYDLLAPHEQRLFAVLSVFAGGFTDAAAAVVGGALAHGPIEVAAHLETLVGMNLLRRFWDAEDAPRYRMLETIHEYARCALRASGEEEAARRAAASCFVAHAERADMMGEGLSRWLSRLDADHDNFQLTLEWCEAHGHLDIGLRLCVILMPLWTLRDHQLEAGNWLETFMVNKDVVPTTIWARRLMWQGLLLLHRTGDHVAATRHVADARILFRECGDQIGACEALQAEGDIFRFQQQWALAHQRYADSLTLAEQSGNTHLVAHAYMGMARCALEQQAFDEARCYWQLTLDSASKAASEATMARSLTSLGELARQRGDWVEAEHSCEHALTLARNLGYTYQIALTLRKLGYVALARQDLADAKQLFMTSLSLCQGRRYTQGMADCLAGLGNVAAAAGHPERAARLCGASLAILERLGTRLDPLDRADFDHTLCTLRTRLSDRLDPLLDEGRAMPPETAVAFATGS